MIDTQSVCEYTETADGFTCRHCKRSMKRPAKRVCPRMPYRQIGVPPAPTGAEIAEKQAWAKEFNADEVTKAFAEQSRNPLPLGDMVETVAKAVGADRVAAWYSNWTGKDCGCNGRKQWLNAAGAWLSGATKPPQAKPQRTGTIKVAFLSPTLGLGGAERWILSLCSAWQDRSRVTVSGIALTTGAQSWEPFCLDAERMGVPVLASTELHGDQPNAKRGLVRMRSADDALRQALDGADVLIHWGIPHMRGIVQRVRWNGPSVSVSHGSGDWTLNMTTQAANGSTHFAAVSKPSMMAQPKAVRERTKILWNGVDPSRVNVTLPREAMRNTWGLQSDDIAIGYVGRLSDEKRPMAIAHAWMGLGGKIDGRRVVPVWVGDGWQGEKYRSLIRQTVGTAGRIIGPTNDVGSVLNALDVYCLASPGEGFSVGLLEAWVAGTTTVATPVGSVPELEERFGQMAHRVPINATPEQVAEAVTAAVNDRGAVAKRAQAVALEHLSLTAMGERWADWLGEIV